jgi:hypothetical protein
VFPPVHDLGQEIGQQPAMTVPTAFVDAVEQEGWGT